MANPSDAAALAAAAKEAEDKKLAAASEAAAGDQLVVKRLGSGPIPAAAPHQSKAKKASAADNKSEKIVLMIRTPRAEALNKACFDFLKNHNARSYANIPLDLAALIFIKVKDVVASGADSSAIKKQFVDYNNEYAGFEAKNFPGKEKEAFGKFKKICESYGTSNGSFLVIYCGDDAKEAAGKEKINISDMPSWTGRGSRPAAFSSTATPHTPAATITAPIVVISYDQKTHDKQFVHVTSGGFERIYIDIETADQDKLKASFMAAIKFAAKNGWGEVVLVPQFWEAFAKDKNKLNLFASTLIAYNQDPTNTTKIGIKWPSAFISSTADPDITRVVANTDEAIGKARTPSVTSVSSSTGTYAVLPSASPSPQSTPAAVPGPDVGAAVPAVDLKKEFKGPYTMDSFVQFARSCEQSLGVIDPDNTDSALAYQRGRLGEFFNIISRSLTIIQEQSTHASIDVNGQLAEGFGHLRHFAQTLNRIATDASSSPANKITEATNYLRGCIDYNGNTNTSGSDVLHVLQTRVFAAANRSVDSSSAAQSPATSRTAPSPSLLNPANASASLGGRDESAVRHDSSQPLSQALPARLTSANFEAKAKEYIDLISAQLNTEPKAKLRQDLLARFGESFNQMLHAVQRIEGFLPGHPDLKEEATKALTEAFEYLTNIGSWLQQSLDFGDIVTQGYIDRFMIGFGTNVIGAITRGTECLSSIVREISAENKEAKREESGGDQSQQHAADQQHQQLAIRIRCT
ncbi:MAG: hypothetical protein M1561_05845 [Gammaproteobacteria bacterium]|nr:hypothetical protein [Gammaproteobacteria bacterium]